MDPRRWYFVCACCGAKWFATRAEMPCPRCGSESRSTEQLVPPWLAALKVGQREVNAGKQ
jgi:anaerobic ribonucleoside-triphosphate reductase